MTGSPPGRAGAVVLCILLAGVLPALSQDWRIPDADVRFTLKLGTRPTHASAGYFAHLPDGGILPGPFPYTTVVVDGGKKSKRVEEVESYTLWHNRQGGLYIVFADPGKAGRGDVHVYVSGKGAPKAWSPASGLTPSAILCTDPTAADMSIARRLAKPGTVGPTVHAANKPGVRRAPFSIGTDDSGRLPPASFYMLAHVVTSDPGKTWIAPFTLRGETQVRVDGKKLTPRQRNEKWGGTGEYFDLTKGLHRVEVFQTASQSGRGALMYLTWRTPHATMKELGGVRSKKAPKSGTSRMETRVLKSSEIARSGSCSVESAMARGGGPVACARVNPSFVYWFGGERPLIVYDLEAMAGGHPAGTVYQWEFPGGVKAGGKSVRWMFPGFTENQVALTAAAGNAVSMGGKSFFGFTRTRTSLRNPNHRKAFRDTLRGMIEAYPADPDPVANWDRAYWNNLIRTMEAGEGFSLLHPLLTTRLETVRKVLPPAQVALLEDLLLDMQQRRDPAAAMKLIDLFSPPDENAARRDELTIRRAELHMYYLGNLKATGQGLTKIAEGTGELAEWAKIRLGDIAFLEGDLNTATRHYADVQNLARKRRNLSGALSGLVTEGALRSPKPDAGKPAPKPKSATNFQGLPDREGAESGDGRSEGELWDRSGGEWKKSALREVSFSENVAKLIEQGFLLEAQKALRVWERVFPLSKISGDFILRESKFHMKLKDWKRARPMLEAYCKQMDASSFLPDAARMLIACAREMKSPPEEIRETIEKVEGRLKYHPVAEELRAYLAGQK